MTEKAVGTVEHRRNTLLVEIMSFFSISGPFLSKRFYRSFVRCFILAKCCAITSLCPKKGSVWCGQSKVVSAICQLSRKTVAP